MKPSRHTIRHFSGRLIARRLAAVALTIGITISASAATYSYRFNATPLNEALSRIIADHPEVTVSFIFNELETYRTSAHVNADDPYTALRQLVAFNPIKIVSNRDIYFVEAMQHGRYCYTGRVEASDGAPVIAATVMALTPDDHIVITYGLTDSEGRFSIPCDRTSILLKISALGYRTDTITPTSFNLGNIRLATDAIALANVTVTARNISRVDDHLEIIPDKNQLKHAATGYQLLRNLMLPGMDVDPFNGSVTLFGQNVSLYINGEPAEYRMVQNLRPKDVERIEYHDAPVGRYAGDFAAINFITRRQTMGGYATFDAQQSIGGYLYGDYNGFSKINRGNTNYYVFAGYGMKNSAALQLEKFEEFNPSSRSIDRTFTSIGGRERNYGEYGQFTVQNLTDRRSITLSTGLSGNHYVSTSSGRMVYSEPINLTQTTDTRNASSAISPRLSYYGQFNIRENDYLITSFNASYAHSTYNHVYSADDDGVISDTKDNSYNLAAQVMYQFYLKHRNSLQFTLRDNYRVASTNYLGTYGSWQHMWNSSADLYAEYNQYLGDHFRISVRPGLSTISIGLHGSKQQNYYYPTLFSQLTYNPTRQQQFNFNVTISNSSPSLSDRTEAEQPIDLIMSRRGNPSLKDAKLYNFRTTYSAQIDRVNLMFYLSLRYDNDALTTAYQSDGDKLILSIYNGDYKMVNFSPKFTWKITDNLRVQTGGSLCHFVYDNRLSKQQLNFATGYLSLMYFWQNISFAVQGTSSSRFLTSDYRYAFSPAAILLNIAWTHRNWRVDAWTNTFERATSRRWINTNAYKMNQRAHGRFTTMLKVAYSFDFGKKVEREYREADTSIESNILK